MDQVIASVKGTLGVLSVILALVFGWIFNDGFPLIAEAEGTRMLNLRPVEFYFSDANTIMLVKAALAGNMGFVRQSVAAGGDPNAEGPMEPLNANRLRPLHYSIAASNLEAIAILLEAGADPELIAQNTGNALEFSAMLHKPAAIKVILDRWPVAKFKPQSIEQALDSSLLELCIECIENLIDAGAPINEPDSAGSTLFMSAISQQSFDVAIWLAQHGARVDVETPNGVTAAYQVQRLLGRLDKSNDSYNQLGELKTLMERQGIRFPVPTPEEVRQSRHK